jgi:carbamate kinase
VSPGAKPPLLVVALGGNAIQSPEGEDSVVSDFERTMTTARTLVTLATEGPWRLVVTHGNGPQVGNHLLRSELGNKHGGLPLLPLDVCVADTQGGMGYMLQQCISDAFHERGLPAVVATLVTQTIVDADDPGFATPSKPVGEMIPAERAAECRARGWTLVMDKRRGGWRRVVPSPDPKEVVEAAAVKALVEDGVIVVAVGGGGIPVIQERTGILTGVAAVVDKDLASAMLAIDLDADALLILTDVDKVSLDYGLPSERPLDKMTVAGARVHLRAGQFAPGSMGPKVEALCRFAAARKRPAAITSISGAPTAFSRGGGTIVSD